MPGGEVTRKRWRFVLPALTFGTAYGAAVGLGGVIGALWLRHGIEPRLGTALLLFTVGAALAGFLTALVIGRTGMKRRTARFAAALVLLIILTTVFDAVLLYVEYAGYYVQWWPPLFSVHWFFTATTTFLGVSFYFVALGVPMIVPLGLPLTLLAALLLARR